MWVPAFLRECFLAGLSTSQRSESLNSFFDRYIHKKINLKELVRQYGAMLQSRYEEEDMADFDTWHKQPALRSPSPWEKQISTVYTHVIFRKFQVEVLGVVGCHPKKEKESGGISNFRVDDCEKVEHFMVTWNEVNSEVSCSCMMFENRGFLCRHSMIVLQICGISSIPSRYILKRWTKDAKSRQAAIEGTERIQNRVQRYNDLCKRAIELGEEGSLSEDNHNIACRTLIEALKDCVNINNRNTMELSSSNAVALRRAEEDNQIAHSTETNKKKIANKRRKLQTDETAVVEAQAHLQQVENLCSDGMTLNGFCGSQHNMHGLLNLMEPPQNAYYVGQQTIPGLGQLNPVASGHGFYGVQQSMPGLGHLDFRQQSFSYGIQDEEHNVRSLQLQDNARHT